MAAKGLLYKVTVYYAKGGSTDFYIRGKDVALEVRDACEGLDLVDHVSMIGHGHKLHTSSELTLILQPTKMLRERNR